jgi:hypothetical protein
VIHGPNTLASGLAALSPGLNSRTIDEVDRDLGQVRAAVRGARFLILRTVDHARPGRVPSHNDLPRALGGGWLRRGGGTSLHLPLSVVTAAATGEWCSSPPHPVHSSTWPLTWPTPPTPTRTFTHWPPT